MNVAVQTKSNAAGTLSGQMASFVERLQYDDLPADVQRLSHLVLLDALGCALAGSLTPELTAIRQTVCDLGEGQGTSAIWGTDETASPPLAALANGAAIHVREIDDFGGCAHSGSVVIPAALGVAASLNASGKELLTAIVAGYDIARRVMDGGGGYLTFKKRGWHSTSTCGGFGAAAAAGRLLKLDARKLQWALGYAGSNAGGTWAFIPDGAMNKRLHPGFAAQTGVMSAFLAKNDVTAPATILEEEWGGYFSTYVPGLAQPEKAVDGLGSDYRIRLVGFKPYAACRGIHSSIEVVLRLRETHGIKAESIDHIVVRGSQTHKRQLGRQDVRTTLDAQMSLPYSVAVAAVSGRASLDEFTPAALERPDVRAMAGRVDVTLDDSVADGAEPWIDVHLADGSVLTDRIPIARGDHANPLSEEELLEKFRASAGLLLHADQVAMLEHAIMNCTELADVSSLVPLLKPGVRAPALSAKQPRNPLIVQAQVLAALPNHDESALPEAYQPRLLHLSDKLVRGADLFITSRIVVDLASPAEPNVHPHRHDVSQTYVFTSDDGSLRIEVLLGDRKEVIQAPATVFIPAGLQHALRLLSGTGTVLSIVRSGVYE